MASGDPVGELSEELTCPICLEYFRDPVILTECGHSFCRACLTWSWGEAEAAAAAEASCPVCKRTARPGDLRPSRQLANIVEICKKLSLQGREARKEEAGERICEKHREPLKLFCQTDEILICTVCDRSKEHKSHEVIPAEEAAQEYQDKIFNCLESLRREREKILGYLADAEDESQEMLKITESERQKTVAEFRTLRQLLEEQEKRLLAQIEEVEKEIARKRDNHLARLSEELSSLGSLIREMEEKHQQPVSELLQDVRSSLQRCKEKENFENPVAFSSDLQWRLECCCGISPFLKDVMKQFKGNVTLDPDTAHPQLLLSQDHRSVKREDKWQELPDNPERFDQFGIVLGSEGFASGRHSWEVRVGSEGEWAVGVARKSVRRKGEVVLSPEGGIWAVGRWAGGYKACIRGKNPHLNTAGQLKRIRVTLDCDGGQVAFFDGDSEVQLYVFSAASFSGETLQPFFWLHKKAHLRLFP